MEKRTMDQKEEEIQRLRALVEKVVDDYYREQNSITEHRFGFRFLLLALLVVFIIGAAHSKIIESGWLLIGLFIGVVFLFRQIFKAKEHREDKLSRQRSFYYWCLDPMDEEWK